MKKILFTFLIGALSCTIARGMNVATKQLFTLARKGFLKKEVQLRKRIQKLINLGAQLNEYDDCGKTPLHYAAEYGWENVAKGLLEVGANPDLFDYTHKTAREIAQTNLHDPVIAVLDAYEVLQRQAENDAVDALLCLACDKK